MSQQNFLEFILTLRENTEMRFRYNRRNLSQILFHAKNEGFDFTIEEIEEVIGKLEANVILQKDKDAFDGTSRLWREMWGKYHVEYVINDLVRRHTNEELTALLTPKEGL